MIAVNEFDVEAVATLKEQRPGEFERLLCLIGENSAIDHKAATARGASAAREENCGRAQVWGELYAFLAEVSERWEHIQRQRKAGAVHGASAWANQQQYSGPYEEPLNHGPF
jgi:hypothetical protein